MPAAFYGGAHVDRVEKHGRLIGVSPLAIYSSNVRSWISLAMIDEAELQFGSEVELVLGRAGRRLGQPAGGAAQPDHVGDRRPAAVPPGLSGHS